VLVLALRCAETGLSLQRAGLVMGAGAVAPALLSIPLGSVIDRVGARRTFVVAAAATAALSLAFAVTESFAPLIALQLVMGCTRTTAWVASQDYITGFGTAAERSAHAGRFGFFVGAGQMTAAALAGLVSQWAGTGAGFLFGAGYSVAFLLLAASLPDLAGHRRDPVGAGGFRQAVRLARIPAVQAALLLSGARLTVVATYSALVPLLLTAAGTPSGKVGLVIATKGGVATVSALATGPLARRLGTFPLGVLALGTGTAGLALTPWLDGTVTAFIPAALVGLAVGLSLPVILATLAHGAPPGHRALSLSMRESTNQVATTLAPPAVGGVTSLVGTRLGFAATACLCLGMLGVAALRGRDRPGPATGTRPP
jgi:predicted MFS family arabinose efflux permease